MDERIKQICRCMDELARIRQVVANGEWKNYGSSLMDAQVGELDWLSELHYHLYGAGAEPIR